MTQTATAAIPAYRHFDAQVRRVTQLSPHFIRVTFTGGDLDLFGTTCLDQRVKVVFPLAGSSDPFAYMPRSADWYAQWRGLPEHQRNPFRTYTVRDVRPEVDEVDIDFVTHGDVGVASAWVQRAAPGDRCILVGPDRRADSAMVGVEWKPGDATELLLAGDETATPAILSILADLPADARGHAFLEIPGPDDVLHAQTPEGVTVTWLPRFGDDDFGAQLVPAVKNHIGDGTASAPATPATPATMPADDDAVLWDTPSHEPGAGRFAWLAGEATAITTLRRHLVKTCGWDRSRVAFMGYWKKGKTET